MSDYWKNWPSDKVLGSVKYVCNFEIFHLEPKNIKFFLQMFSDETFHPETASTNMTYGSFHPGRELTAIELEFFSFALKPINLWIYFQNFCNFVCM